MFPGLSGWPWRNTSLDIALSSSQIFDIVRCRQRLAGLIDNDPDSQSLWANAV